MPLPPLPTPLHHLILYGGSFDPPHLAHTTLPQQARSSWAADYAIDPASTLLLYIPASRSPHKTSYPQATDQQRLEMLELALAQSPAAAQSPTAISTLELNPALASAPAAASPAPSYTIDTALTLRHELDTARLLHTQLHLLIGTDQLLALHRWRRPRELLALAPPMVMLRPPNTDPDALAQSLLETGAWSSADLAHLLSALVLLPTMDISSTATRATAAAAHHSGNFNPLASLVGPAVAEYIRQNRLYAPPT